MFLKFFSRNFHKTCISFQNAEKSALAALRKRTGYTFQNCKKALELNENNLEKAEKWLNDQALSLGWQKATKLEGRKMRQGLISTFIDKDSNGSMVEINCETDFVARNEHFINFAKTATLSCQNFIKANENNNGLVKINLNSNNLKSLNSINGKTLNDDLVILIGNVSENTNLRRAVCIKIPSHVHLINHTHPSTNNVQNDINFGKYGTLLALEAQNSMLSANDLNVIGKNVAQNIIGMNPIKVGEIGVDIPQDDIDNENCLIFQELLIDPSKLVHQYLDDFSVKILDFVRFECGEHLENE